MPATQEAQTTEKASLPLREPSPFNLPNFLTTLRFGLAIVMFVLIGQQEWLWTGIVFALASITDWLDGVAARRLGIVSSFGRSFDPLVDKLLMCGAFICMLAYPAERTGLYPWMVVVIVMRELLVTSLRGYIESQGIAFGADTGGKIKMVLQCLALAMILLCLLMQTGVSVGDWQRNTALVRDVLIYAMVVATVYSGISYLWISFRLYRKYQATQN